MRVEDSHTHLSKFVFKEERRVLKHFLFRKLWAGRVRNWIDRRQTEGPKSDHLVCFGELGFLPVSGDSEREAIIEPLYALWNGGTKLAPRAPANLAPNELEWFARALSPKSRGTEDALNAAAKGFFLSGKFSGSFLVRYRGDQLGFLKTCLSLIDQPS